MNDEGRRRARAGGFGLAAALVLGSVGGGGAGSVLLAAEGEGAAAVANFVIKDLEGKDVSFADLRDGGPILIAFWATWCKPCKQELPYVQSLHEEYAESGLRVVAISVDDTRSLPKARAFIKTQGFGFRALHDTNQRALRQLQGTAIPYVLLISPEGERLYAHTGYRPGDEKELAGVVAEVMAEYGVRERPGEAEVEPGAGGGDGGAEGGARGEGEREPESEEKGAEGEERGEAGGAGG